MSASILNGYLTGRKFLVADVLSVADFAVAITLPYTDAAKLPLREFPEIERWHARLNELPAWREPFRGCEARGGVDQCWPGRSPMAFETTSRKEHDMQLNPYLQFKGNCEEAFKFYERCLGGKIAMMMRYGKSPMADQTPAEFGTRSCMPV